MNTVTRDIYNKFWENWKQTSCDAYCKIIIKNYFNFNYVTNLYIKNMQI